jgi:hypothetical protein
MARVVRRIGALAICFLTAAAWPGPAAADRGVSISLGSVAVSVPMRPGQEYRLPQLYVLNPGDEPSSYVMDAVPIANDSRSSIEPAWLTFDPATFTLEPGGRRNVAVVLRLPEETPAGDYLGMIRAVLATDPSGGALLGAAAGSRLTFTVDSGPASLLRDLLGAWNAGGAASWVGAGLLATVALSLILRRRFSFRIERRP